MQRNRTGVMFVKMLMNLERISFAVEFAAERLVQRCQPAQAMSTTGPCTWAIEPIGS
jgi:hypothetical protein